MTRTAIPAIVHQTWRSTSPPAPFPALIATWKSAHPDWAYEFWTDADIHELVRSCYPELLPVFEALRLKIEQIDIARCLILHRYGGLYADLDTECIRPFDPLLADQRCVLFNEPAAHRYEHAPCPLVSNAVMAAVPGHPLLDSLIERFARLDPDSRDRQAVLERTGPIMLTEAIADHAADDHVILEAGKIAPFSANDPRLDRLLSNPHVRELRTALAGQGTYAVHYWFNGWAHPSVFATGRASPGLDGYSFHSRVDSPGHDYPEKYDDPQSLLDAAERLQAAGFNTAGYLKFHIRPPADWVSWPGTDDDEGLYVRNAFHFGDGRT